MRIYSSINGRTVSGNNLYQTLACFLLLLLASCSVLAPDKAKPLRTENVVIVMIDGPRYSEMWDTPARIPNLSGKMSRKGVFLNNFLNAGYTYTNAGHAAVTTGINQEIDNYGAELPQNPSVFQYWLKATGKPSTAAWFITSKDKLNILGNTSDSLWQNQYLPSLNCGVDGPGSGYRADSLTLLATKQILSTYKPNLVLINFMEPDGYAHAGNWNKYLWGISSNDRYVSQLWDFLNEDKNYSKKTTLLILSDHGRHLDSVKTGWIDHGDDCAGCQHVGMLAMGPDFNKSKTVATRHTLIDVTPTVALLLGIKFEQGEGKVMRELFRRKALKKLGL